MHSPSSLTLLPSREKRACDHLGLAFALSLCLSTTPALAAPDCAYRRQATDQAWAAVIASADKTSETAAASRGDHCDEQIVEGRVLEVVKGPLAAGQPLRFSLSQGACGDPRSVNDDFVQPGARLVLLLARDIAGGVYQVRAETPQAYAANEAACRRR